MTEPFFFPRPMGLTLGEIAALTGAEPQAGAELDRRITNIAPLDRAGPRDITFLDNVKFSQQLAATQAGACLMGAKLSAKAPARTAALSCPEPYQAFVAVARALFPSALRPSSLFDADGIMPGASVHPTARMEADVKIDPAAIVGPRAEIGSGTVIGAGTVIGPGVRVGRDCAIGGNATISNALIGDRVIIHPGCQIGQDGFGYVMRPGGHLKVPQLGRVIIQNEVEIGANSTVDRGAIRDTIIGEGTKIDNLVQVGHNVSIGRHCVIIAQSGISGSSTLEDHVVLGARVGVGNQFTIGEGAQLAALSVVASDVPAGARWGGFPAKPVQLWIRETKALERMAVRNYGVSRADLKGRPAQKDD